MDARGDRLGMGQLWLLGVLGLPAFGVAFAYTVVGTYLPVLLADLYFTRGLGNVAA